MYEQELIYKVTQSVVFNCERSITYASGVGILILTSLIMIVNTNIL